MSVAPRRVGLIGSPVAHSRSPAMQQAAFDTLGIAARYALWPTPPERLADRIGALRAPEMLGANVTVPYKRAVAPLLDSLAGEAERLGGVVNTIVRVAPSHGDGVDARLVGHNTDLPALERVLEDAGAWRGARRALVVGAGGAAMAALGALLARGVEPWVVARRPAAAIAALERVRRGWVRAGALAVPAASAASMAERVLDLAQPEALGALLPRMDLLIQATPAGMADPAESAMPLALLALLPAHAYVLDVVYAAHTTALVRAARDAGRRAQDGLALLLHQGALAFTLWTGREAPLAVMRQALLAAAEGAGPHG